MKLRFFNFGSLNNAIDAASKALGIKPKFKTFSLQRGNEHLSELVDKAEARNIKIEFPTEQEPKVEWRFKFWKEANAAIAKLETSLGMAVGDPIYNIVAANRRYEQLAAFKAKQSPRSVAPSAAPVLSTLETTVVQPIKLYGCNTHPEFQTADQSEACPLCSGEHSMPTHKLTDRQAALLEQCNRITDTRAAVEFERVHASELWAARNVNRKATITDHKASPPARQKPMGPCEAEAAAWDKKMAAQPNLTARIQFFRENKSAILRADFNARNESPEYGHSIPPVKKAISI